MKIASAKYTLVCLLLILSGLKSLNAQHSEFQLIWDRMTDPSFDIPDDKRMVPPHSTNVDNLLLSLDEFNADGSYKTALPKITEAEKNDAGSMWDKHKTYLKYVKNIAVLYGYNKYYAEAIPASEQGKVEYKELVYKTLKWYFENHTPPIGVYHETFSYHPYSNHTVGLLTYIGMMLFDDFHADRKTDPDIQKLFDDMIGYCHHMLIATPQTKGPNWSFRWGNCMRYVLFSDDPAEMDIYRTVNDASHGFDVWGEIGRDGLWPDWTLTHHGDMNYWGMYGSSWFRNSLELASILKGTKWEYAEKNIRVLETSAVEGLQWILYKGNTEYTTAPKRLTYYIDRTDGVAADVINNLKLLVELHGEKLQDRSQMEYMIGNIDPSWKDDGKNYNEVTGHKYFWNSEYQVHRRNNYSIAVRRTSKRVRGPEDSSNSDIKCHLQFGSGYTSILRRGDEYRLSRLGLDYQTVAGTTTERNGIVNAGKAGSTKRGMSVFSGGAAEGGFGAGAFEMKLGEYDMDNNIWELVNGAGALKGNFFFNNEMVCLGQDVKRIQAGSDEVWTTLNQLQRHDDVVYSIDNQASVTIGVDETVNEELTVNASAWFWHDHVGYIMTAEAATNVKLMAERRTLNSILMQDNYYVNALSEEDKAAGTINMFQLAINHGTSPTGEKYNYRVVPDVSLYYFQQYMALNTTSIQNTENIQAVYNAVDKVLEAVFYEPGEVTLDNGKNISVDKKAIVLIRQDEDELIVSASNPVHRGLTPEFEVSASETVGELYETPINIALSGFGIADESDGIRVIPIQLPVERAFEGQTVSQTVKLASGGGFSEVTLPLLEGITIDGEPVAGFSPLTFSYSVDLLVDEGTAVDVKATSNAANNIEYINQDANTVLIKVNGITTYTVNINRKGAVIDKYTETFTNLVNDGGFMSKSFVGDNNITWNIDGAKYDASQGTGGGIYIRGGHVESGNINTGIGNFSVTLFNRWNDAAEPVITTLYINDQEVASNTNSTNEEVYTFEVNNINISGGIVIKIKNTSATTTTLVIDNISWTPYSGSNGGGSEEPVAVTGVSLDKTSLELPVDLLESLIATVEPENASNKQLIWECSDNSVAQVINGIVYAIGEGAATIIVTTIDGSFQAQCAMTIVPALIPVTSIAMDQTTANVNIGESLTLPAIIQPSGATNKDVKWTTSDYNIATVSDGIVTGIEKGDVLITATSRDGYYKATCAVNVLEETGIDDNLLDYIKVFTLPNKRIQVNNSKEGTSYQLYDISGAVIQNGKITSSQYTIQTNVTGLYVLSIKSNNLLMNKKVCIK